ncbi:Copia protein [Termitomyces sp. T112]|nr:Copia protein [Termitomyces sp. T112]
MNSDIQYVSKSNWYLEARMESWHILLHLAAAKGWDATQIDVKTAFLYGILPEDEVQFMKQPKGFEEEGKEDWVWMLVSKEENERFKHQMRQVWTISDLGLPCFVVGIAVEWDRANHTVKLSQMVLIDKIICQFGQTNATPLLLPMDPNSRLRQIDRDTLPLEERHILERTPYRQLVGCLLYLAISTRPDIAFGIQQLTQYLDCYATPHWNAAICLVQYLKGTCNLQLHLGGKGNDINLIGFMDSDWASCLNTRRSVGGYTWSLGAGAVSWAVRTQRTVAASSCEAEYMAAFESAQECIWLRALLKDIGHDHTSQPTQMFCNNNSAIALSEDPLLHARVKHIDIKYHFLHERVQSNKIALHQVPSKENTTDIFTKVLPSPAFMRLCPHLGLQ